MRDAARADADCAEARNGSPSQITSSLWRDFGVEARRQMRKKDGGWRRGQIQALAQRVEVAEDEIRIRGSKMNLLQIPVAFGAGHGVEKTANGVRSFVPKWLPGPDSNQRPSG